MSYSDWLMRQDDEELARIVREMVTDDSIVDMLFSAMYQREAKLTTVSELDTVLEDAYNRSCDYD